jgi:hypothetical protein
MDSFLSALRNRDVAGFLSHFPKSATWDYIGTITDPPQVTRVAFTELESDLVNKKAWYEALFDAGGDDCFRDWAVNFEDSAWTETRPGRFVLRQTDGRDSVYVEWRNEAHRWVVSAIAEPAA